VHVVQLGAGGQGRGVIVIAKGVTVFMVKKHGEARVRVGVNAFLANACTAHGAVIRNGFPVGPEITAHDAKLTGGPEPVFIHWVALGAEHFCVYRACDMTFIG
jgi:hypothetical protein